MTKGKLIVTVGMSNSGKSTWAANTVQQNPKNFIRVNRDDIRNLLFGYTDESVENYYRRGDLNQLEKQVTRFEDSIIYDALELGKTVIVDATHLRREYLERFKYWNVDVELVFFDIPLGEAFKRNNLRMRKVNEAVMKKQFDQYRTLKKSLEENPIDFTPIVLGIDESKPSVFVFDIDGTLAHKGNRSAYDWHRVGEDSVDRGISELTGLIAHSNRTIIDDGREDLQTKMIIATGRDGVCLPETEQWLENHGIEYDGIYIRDKGDMRPDWLVKQEMAQAILKDHYILGWFDDRLQVSRHLRMLGLNVYNVAHGNF